MLEEQIANTEEEIASAEKLKEFYEGMEQYYESTKQTDYVKEMHENVVKLQEDLSSLNSTKIDFQKAIDQKPLEELQSNMQKLEGEADILKGHLDALEDPNSEVAKSYTEQLINNISNQIAYAEGQIRYYQNEM